MTIIHPSIKTHLSTNEQILWSGQPRQGVIIRGADAFLIPFSLLWGSFVIYWEFLAIESDAPLIFVLFGVPFVLIGIYLMVGRFIVEAKQRAHTYYAVTNVRILIVSGVWSQKVKSLNLRTLPTLSLCQAKQGEGTISFGGAMPFAEMFAGFAGLPGMDLYLGACFEKITNAKNVFEIIGQAQRAA